MPLKFPAFPGKNYSQKENILYTLVTLFLATLYFSQINAVSSSLAGIITLYCLFYNPISEKKDLLRQRKPVQFMLLFYLFLVVSALFSDNVKYGLGELEIRLPLLLFPVSLGLIQIRRELLEKILLTFALLTTAIGLLCLIYAITNVVTYQDTAYLYNDALTHIIRRQSVHIGLTVNLAVYILAYFIILKKQAYKELLILAALLLFGFSYFIASRIMFATLIGMGFACSIYYIIRYKKIKQGLFLVAGMVAGVLLIYTLFPQTFNRYRELAYSKYNFENKGAESHYNMKITEDQWNGANFRLAAWACGKELIQENPVFGVGLGDKHEALFDKYREKNFYFAIETKKNIHSNYLDILYSTGFAGFILFFLGWIALPLFQSFRFRDGLAVIMILTFCMAWFTEVYFARSFGNMLTGFFITFLLTDKTKPEKHKSLL